MLDITNCNLCPRRCGIDRTRRAGFCGAGDKVRIALVSLHQWEEPCLVGERGAGTVFFSYCNLRCVYCQNHEISHGGKGGEVSTERLAEIFLEQQARGAATLDLVTPTHYVADILPALDMARSKGLYLPVVYNTSGYERAEIIRAVAPVVDVFLTDARYAKQDTAKRYSQAKNYVDTFREALDAMVKSDARIIVRILVLPGHIDEACENIRWIHESYGSRVTFSLMGQYTPMKKVEDIDELGRTLYPDEYEFVLDFADNLGIQDYFWQEGDAAQESFIPDFYECAGVLSPL